MITDAQKEAAIELLEVKMRKWKKPKVNIAILSETISRQALERFYFGIGYEDFKEIFEERFVNCKKPTFKLEETGFLDKKQRYPYDIYQRVATAKPKKVSDKSDNE